jgi:hypothetical protein
MCIVPIHLFGSASSYLRGLQPRGEKNSRNCLGPVAGERRAVEPRFDRLTVNDGSETVRKSWPRRDTKRHKSFGDSSCFLWQIIFGGVFVVTLLGAVGLESVRMQDTGDRERIFLTGGTRENGVRQIN